MMPFDRRVFELYLPARFCIGPFANRSSQLATAASFNQFLDRGCAHCLWSVPFLDELDQCRISHPLDGSQPEPGFQ